MSRVFLTPSWRARAAAKALLTVALLVATPALGAQAQPPVSPGKIGFTIDDGTNLAGISCSGFQCASMELQTGRGQVLTFRYRTTFGSPYVLLAGPVHFGTCVPLPGIGNLWAGPGWIVGAGRISQTDAMIRCWGGYDTLKAQIPQAIGLKTTAWFQLVADNLGNGPVFSAPVQVTVVR
jgi:hypothetical protein